MRGAGGVPTARGTGAAAEWPHCGSVSHWNGVTTPQEACRCWVCKTLMRRFESARRLQERLGKPLGEQIPGALCCTGQRSICSCPFASHEMAICAVVGDGYRLGQGGGLTEVTLPQALRKAHSHGHKVSILRPWSAVLRSGLSAPRSSTVRNSPSIRASSRCRMVPSPGSSRRRCQTQNRSSLGQRPAADAHPGAGVPDPPPSRRERASAAWPTRLPPEAPRHLKPVAVSTSPYALRVARG